MRIQIRSNRWRAPGAWLLALLVFAAACSDENELDLNLITTTELPDVFTFSVAGLDKMTGARRYLWAMTGNQATVDVTSSLSDGSAFLQIRGGDGAVVYAEDIRTIADDTTKTNTAGLWQIDVVIEKASGDFTFTLERDTIP